ncbi:MAG: hypothetical protein ACLP6E_06515 [Acidimicrobiales bacterium]
MAFGQQSGPPASSRQIRELLSLLKDAGHDGFRDARGPMGFTQRQAAGRFTRDEATGFIEQLQETELPGGASAAEIPDQHLPPDAELLRRIPAGRLADELRCRGWTVVAPELHGVRPDDP